jgi:hypothetical protein
VIKKSEKDPQMKILSIKCQTAVNKTTKRNEIITVSGVLANKGNSAIFYVVLKM